MPLTSELDRANWMANLEDKTIHINRLRIPATHNSATTHLHFAETPDCEQTRILNFLKWLPRLSTFAGELIGRWTCTQEKTITEQLEMGIRSFDFRFLYNEDSDTFWISHSYAACPLEEPLTAIQEFLNAHPDEIIIVHLTMDYEHKVMTEPKLKDAFEIVKQHLGDRLIERTNLEDEKFTIANLQSHATQRVILNMDFFPERGDDVWDSLAFRQYWPNEDEPEKVEAYLDSHVTSVKKTDPKHFKQFSAIVTESKDTISHSAARSASSFFKDFGLKHIARETNSRIMGKLESDPELTNGTPVIALDYPEQDNIDSIIRMNSQ